MATVDVILREKVESLGAEADVVSVKAGYARNFLIPKQKAFEATKGNLLQLEKLKAVRAERESKELQAAEELAAQIRKIRVELELAVGQGGKAFGSVTTQDLQAEIAKRKIEVDRHDILLEKPIKTTGDFVVPVKIHPDVNAQFKVKVTAASKKDDAESAEG